MRFYQLWEEINQQLTREDFYKLVKSFWGNCQHLDHPDRSIASCNYENRHLVFSYIPSIQAVGIAFGWNETPAISSKETGTFVFATGANIQSGSIEGMHKFINLAKIFKSHGLKIGFTTSGRREKLYDRALSMAGYQKSSNPNVYE